MLRLPPLAPLLALPLLVPPLLAPPPEPPLPALAPAGAQDAPLVSGPWQLVRRWDGEAPGGMFGHAVAGVGDVDGDGRGEVAIGAPLAGGAGLALLVAGRDGSVLQRVAIEGSRGKIGQSVAGGADVDVDGRPDWVVGAPGMPRNGPDTGMARVLSGADGRPLRTLFGGGEYQFFGQSVALVGDADGDGAGEVLVGASQEPNADGVMTGGARLVSGGGGALLLTRHGSSDAESVGQSVAAAGDVDGDGAPDVLVGALGHDATGADAGRAWVLSGRGGALLLALDGEAAGDRFGFALAGLGDVDGDGRADVAVGAPGHDGGGDSAGAVLVFSGRDGALLYRVLGGAAGDELGYALAAAGDVDGDGVGDLVAGAYQLFNDGPGYARICSGRDGRTLGAITGTAPGQRLGAAVGGGVDVDGDGRSDVVVGAPQMGGAQGRPAGAVLVYAWRGGSDDR